MDNAPPPSAQHTHQSEEYVQWQTAVSVLLSGQTEEVVFALGHIDIQLLPAMAG